jgi:hypothetical protein
MAAVVGAAVAANGLTTPTTPSFFARALAARAAIAGTTPTPAAAAGGMAANTTATPSAVSTAAALAAAAPASAKASAPPMCEICDDDPATLHCATCDMFLCAVDDAQLHKPASKQGHPRKPI